MNIEKLKKLEQKFWNAYDDEGSTANDLLDTAIDIIAGYKLLYYQAGTKNIGNINIEVKCVLTGIEDVEETLRELQERINNLKITCTI